MNRRQFDMPTRKQNKQPKQVKLSDTDFNTYYPMDKNETIPPFTPPKETKKNKEEKEEKPLTAEERYERDLRQAMENSMK